jgi:anthranilate phosphoribosyltransferase
VLVVNAEDGLDEISIGAPTYVAELKDGQVSTYTITPEEFGLERSPLDGIRIHDAAESLAMMRSVLDNQPGPARDIVALNAGAAIYVAGLAGSLKQGVELALAAIASGEAQHRLEALVDYTARVAVAS